MELDGCLWSGNTNFYPQVATVSRSDALKVRPLRLINDFGHGESIVSRWGASKLHWTDSKSILEEAIRYRTESGHREPLLHGIGLCSAREPGKDSNLSSR